MAGRDSVTSDSTAPERSEAASPDFAKMSDPGLTRAPIAPTLPDTGMGLAVWIAATLVIVLFGGALLPGPHGWAAAFTWLIICLATLTGTFALALSRGSGLDSRSGLRLGATLLVVGLLLDGLLIAIGGFAYPHVDADQSATIVTGFLLAYPFVVLGPWLAGLLSERRAAR